jgi:hypothetical protein
MRKQSIFSLLVFPAAIAILSATTASAGPNKGVVYPGRFAMEHSKNQPSPTISSGDHHHHHHHDDDRPRGTNGVLCPKHGVCPLGQISR